MSHCEAEQIFRFILPEELLLENFGRISIFQNQVEGQAIFDNHGWHQVDVNNFVFHNIISNGFPDEGVSRLAICQKRAIIKVKPVL